MQTNQAKRSRFIITFLVFLILSLSTILAIQLAKGYRPNLKSGQLNGMGLLTTTSYPKTAQVFINDLLTTATDSTIYLEPNSYKVKIAKDGFAPWTKTIPIFSELVSPADARLFPLLPSISPLTYLGLKNPTPSPDGSKIAYVVDTAISPEDNGVFTISINGLTNNFLNSNQTTQLTNLTSFDYTKALLFWSPDGNQVLAAFTNSDKQITSSHLLDTHNFNKTKDLIDTTTKLQSIVTNWQAQLSLSNNNLLNLLPDFMKTVILEKSQNAYFTPDQEKVFFTATLDYSLPANPLKEKLPAINSTPENRDLKKGFVYVFDIKEGTNYEIEEAPKAHLLTKKFITSAEPTPTPVATVSAKIKTKPATPPATTILDTFESLATQSNPFLVGNLVWYSTSRHLIVSTPTDISIVEYDGNNKINLFETNVINSLTLPSSDGHRLIVLTNLNQKSTPINLFSIDLK